ncbi:MAG: RecQ family ATP-dependent DNA helicase [Endozoicomonadaceae bacterium]|nr:RecQ family ATP-dependent DNA helicase [Endozoicomonadaceae bacterium]
MSSQQQARTYLQQALDNPSASFHDGQWESIASLLDKKRVLVVQRTGWGKSMVYFLATKLLREEGAGPTLIISPLLALMRNQLEAAAKIQLNSRTINSTNNDEWQDIKRELSDKKVDVLLISPERLANEDFQQDILVNMVSNIGLLVIDEAHCISDWGHDFRPDYRLIVRVLDNIPSNIPVLATTATANDRVVDDIKAQLGEDITLQRGSLVRKSLKLQNINMPSPAARMAWLVQTIPKLPSSGIIYTLTKRDADRVTKWLLKNNIKAKTYHSDVLDREVLEQQLLDNEIKVLVATVALGMGFDKPDLGFVIHFQRPQSVVHYYQQVGRAGRAVDEAYGILLCGEEDENITDFFIKDAFPSQQSVSEILNVLEETDDGISILNMQRSLNLSQKQINKTLQFLESKSPSPIIKEGSKWHATSAANSYQIDQTSIDEITNIRKKEQQEMRDYMTHSDCLMAFLQNALNDPDPTDCEQCKNCNPKMLLNPSYDDELTNKAGLFLRRNYQPIKPRQQWPQKDMFQHSNLDGYKIPSTLIAEEGRALSLWRDAGWGSLVVNGKSNGKFSDELVNACVEMLQAWSPQPYPEWVTCIPSLRHPNVVPDFAKRLADALGIPFFPCIENNSNHQNAQQKYMENSHHQVKNLDGAFDVTNECQAGSCLLVDDIVDSRWTFTVATALLRLKGCAAVHPLALALNSPRRD